MDSLTFNKFAAGILVALLLVMGIGKLGSILYGPQEVAHDEGVMEAGGEEMAADESGLAEPEEEGMSLAALLNVADLDAGAAVSKKCASCHTFDNGGANRVGPNLWGVVGGPTAHVADFSYSAAIADLGSTWTFEALDAFIHAPKAFAPGTKMTFAGLNKPEDRANLLAWMNQQSSSPIALPEPPAEEPATEEAVEQTEDAAAATGTQTEGETTVAAAENGSENMVDAIGNAAGELADDAGEAMEAVGDAVADAVEGAGDAVDEATGASDASGGNDIEAAIAAASPEEGENVMKKCKSCHTFDEGGPNRVGPNLWGVVGSPVASHEGYSYSSAMKDYGGDWTYERLWWYLHDPRGTVPGTKMTFAGIKNDADVDNLLAWMRLQASEPVPLDGGQ